ncbi:MAG: HlyD family efflux transporter periplasmic adaptor subunit [Thermacetogeniaceae bacterium]
MKQDRSNREIKVKVRKKRLERAELLSRVQIWAGRLVIFMLALLVLVWLGKQAYVFCIAQAIRTESAQLSVLDSGYHGEAIIMRNEKVVTAPVAGNVERLVPEGARVHIGTAVARISGPASPEKDRATVELTSPAAGTVSYQHDGWEGILTPAQYQRMDLFALFGAVNKGQSGDLPQAVFSGDPVYQIIDNLVNPYLVIKLDKQPQDLMINDGVDLNWSQAGQGRGLIIGLSSKPGAWIAVVKVTLTDQDFSTGRTLDVKLINQKYEGIVLPARALVTKGNQQGVWTRSPVGFKFNRVRVVGTMGDKVALQGIEQGLDVVINPDLLKRIDQEI